MLMLGRSDQDHGNYEIINAAAGKTRPVGLYHDDQNENEKKTSEMMTPLSWECMIHSRTVGNDQNDKQ